MKNKKKHSSKTTLIIFIVIICLFVFGILVIKYNKEILNYFNNKENSSENTEDDNNKEKEKEKPVIDPYQDYKNIKNFKLENLNRYLTYKEENPNLDYDTIVTYVNIGLDYGFYTYIQDADLTKDILLLMNKYYKLSENYEPSDLETISSEHFINSNAKVKRLRKEAREQFEKMAEAAITNGTPIYGQSAYRPYSMQASLYNNVVASSGKTYADNDTARPGHSEHQTGLAIDVSSTKSGNMMYFGNTSSFTWMKENAHKYGFILRYPNGKTDITGFMYESWHYRYVGVTVATDMHDNYPNLTYEEYYDKYISN